MPLHVRNRHTKRSTLQRSFPDGEFVDVTSHGPKPWCEFSPLFPHGEIPVPFSPGVTSVSVEGVWQGLKVFENEDVDRRKFAVGNMKGIHRTTERHGPLRGHRAGVKGKKLFDHAEARRKIYLPTYRWVLENRLSGTLDDIRGMAATANVVLLDDETEFDCDDLTKPLSHAALIVCFLEDRWPA
jgi:hypothetical protein